MAVLLSGKDMAAELTAKQAEETEKLKRQGIVPGLAVVLVGEDPASRIYVRNKGLACEKLGFYSKTVTMPETALMEEVLGVIDDLNGDDRVHGILVQLPLPRHLNEAEILARISPEKDVDGFHVVNSGLLMTGQKGVVPCTPKGLVYMLKRANVPLSGKHAVVVGRSNIVGKPAAMLLLQENCTVTICHSKTEDLKAITRSADILVAAVGRPNFITADMVKPGAAVVDVGINRVDGKVVGDVDFDGVEKVAGYLTPVPGGVGKMTISMLMQNTLEAACNRRS